MADIVRADPFDVSGFRRVLDRLFDDSLYRMPAAAAGWAEGSLAVDVSEQDGKIVVRASLPGFKKEDIDVQLNDGVLSVKAEHSEESETKNETYYRRERRYGAVSRRLALPGIVHDAPVDAQLKDGVLTLTVQVPEKARSKPIEIKTA